ncbi:hypothetical protein Ddc_15031 [Ditylenchus destructor]|nr:hypothetical protein Ddc_15031 [Ditylenchus destructor]
MSVFVPPSGYNAITSANLSAADADSEYRTRRSMRRKVSLLVKFKDDIDRAQCLDPLQSLKSPKGQFC